MKFSVIIPTLLSKTLSQTIEVLAKQTFDKSKFEVILVGYDDFSFLEKKKFPFSIKIIQSDYPLSPAKGRNLGAKNAKGDIIVFLDSDCIPRQEWLSILDMKFEDDSIAGVGGGVKFLENNYWDTSDNFSFFHDFLISHRRKFKKEFASLNLAIRKNIFEEVHGFDETFPAPSGEDFDLTKRISNLGYKLLFEPDAWVIHDSQRNSLSKLWKHSIGIGYYSTKRKYFPRFMRKKIIILSLSPILALIALVYNYLKTPGSARYLKYLPGVYISKMGWLVGLSRSLRN
ncbi:MAG: glycosyltransferase family 2 protein [Caldanaerobacter sp.]